jgi:hypothetical protein
LTNRSFTKKLKILDPTAVNKETKLEYSIYIKEEYKPIKARIKIILIYQRTNLNQRGISPK